MKIKEAIQDLRNHGFGLDTIRYDVYSRKTWLMGKEVHFVEDFENHNKIQDTIYDFVKNQGAELVKVQVTQIFTKQEKRSEIVSSTYWLLGNRVIPQVKF